jgi:predicted Zn-dependent protease
VGSQVAANSELSNQPWKFTVLNSHIPNAFALPGGYVYVTRGLLAIMNSEDELAGVLGHEIGHVTARHSAKRYSNSMLVGVGSGILGATTDNKILQQAAAVGGALFLSSYSRKQEYQSDDLGVRYINLTGYDPYAQSDVLNGLGMASNLQAQVSGRSAQGSNMDFFSTHPNTPDRVSRAAGKAAETGIELGARARNTADFLAQIKGIAYGEDGSQGVIQDQSFYHGGLGFKFTVPAGFTLKNSPSAVLIEGPDGSIGMLDAAQADSAQSMSAYLQSSFGQSVALQGVREMQINGLAAASASAQTKINDADAALRLVAFRYSGNQVYRFQFAVAPEKRDALDSQFKAIARSFRPLTQQEKSDLAQSAQRVDIITIQSGDTLDSLASQMSPGTYQRERFLSINGLASGSQLKVGQRVKIIR